MSHSPTKHDRLEGTHRSQRLGPPNDDNNAPPKDPRRVNGHLETNGREHAQLARVATALQDFATQISIIPNLEAGVDRLKKKVEREAEERAKAEKRGFQFPSGIYSVADSREQLKAKDEELQNQINFLDQLTQDLAVILVPFDAQADVLKPRPQAVASSERKSVGQGFDPSRLAMIEGNIRGLQSKVDSALKGNNAKSRISSQVEKGLQSWCSKLESRIEQAVEPRISTLEQQIGDYRARIDSFDARLVSATKSNDHDPSATQKLEDKVASNHETMSKEFANLREGVLSDKASLIHSIARNRADLEAKIASLPATPEARPTPAPSSEELDKLQSNQRNLFEQFECLRKVHDDRHSIVTMEIEKIQLANSRLVKDFDSVSRKVDTLQKEVDLLQQRYPPQQAAAKSTTPAPDPETQKQLQEVRDALMKVHGNVNDQLKSYGFALRSLQINFGNLTSEQIVRQMVNAVSSLYPLPRIQADIDAVCKDVKALHTFVMQRMEQFNAKLDSQEHALQKANEERGISIQEMNTERDRLSSQIETLQTSMGHFEKELPKYATLEQMTLERNKQTAEATTVKSRQDIMEEVTARRLADALNKIEKLEQRCSKLDRIEQEMKFMRRDNQRIRSDNEELLAVIRRFEPDAREEALARYEATASIRDREESHQSDHEGESERPGILSRFHARRQNGHQSSREPSRSHASSDEPESNASSPTRESVAPDAPLDSRASYQPKRRGWHLTASPPLNAPKRPKRSGGSLHFRVSRG